MSTATTADARDLLLAYDPDFVGYSSVAEMKTTLEPRSALVGAPAVEALGGTPDPDGYYEDFSARLERYAQARFGGARRSGGVVVEYDPPPDSDSDSGSGSGDGAGDGADADADADAGPTPGRGGEADAVMGGCNCAVPVPAFSMGDFVVEAPPPVLGRGSAQRGEMDESELERPTFEARRLGPPSILDYVVDA